MNNKSPEEIAAELYPDQDNPYKTIHGDSYNVIQCERRNSWVEGYKQGMSFSNAKKWESLVWHEEQLAESVRIEQELREEIKNAIQRGRDEFKDELQQQLNALGTMHFKVPPKTDKQ